MNAIQFKSIGVSLCLYFITLFSNPFAQGQGVSQKIIPPSPNAVALSKYGDIPVSTYTGVPNIIIPLYEIEVRDITVPISLSYHASGIKVSEEASRVGLGWALNAGGLISRNIVNVDDFFENAGSYLSTMNNAPLLPKGPFYEPVKSVQEPHNVQFHNFNNHTITSFDLAPYTYDVPHDFEPDQFSYNFLEYSGKFVLDRRTDHVGDAVLSKQSKIRIRYTGNNPTSWDVTTADGYVYKFDTFEYFVDFNNSSGNQQKSAWYLTEIISPLNEHVTFHYESFPTEQIHPAGGYSETTSPLTLSCQGFSCTPYPTSPPQHIYGKYYSNIYLSRIEWAHGYLKFNMEDRIDLEGDKRLASMEIFRTGAASPTEVISFTYDYFTSATYGSEFFTDVTPERRVKRLKLLEVSRQSVGSDIPPIKHKFSYYEGQTNDLPPKNSFAQDHWGFYNGKHGNRSLIPIYQMVVNPVTYKDFIGVMGPQRDASPNHTKAFSLKEITYPTQGKTTFHYENHDHAPDDLNVPESYQTSTYMFYDGREKGTVQEYTLDLSDQYVNQFGQTIPVELYAAFRASDLCKNTPKSPNIYFELYYADGVTRISRVELGLPVCEDSDDNVCIYCDDGEFSQSPVFTYRNTYLLQPGIYIWRAFIDDGIPFQDISANYMWWADAEKRPQNSDTPLYYRIAGGLRIAKIEDRDGETNKVTVRKFDYHYTTDNNNNGVPEVRSYGKRMTQPGYSYFDVAWESQPHQHCLECVSLVRVSNSILPLVNSQGVSVGYDQVTEIFGENGELGSIEYEYENSKDQVREYNYPHGFSEIPIQPAAYPTLSFDLNGSLKRKTTRNASGIKVHEITNEYESKFKSILFGLEFRSIRTVGSVDGQTGLLAAYPVLQSTFPFVATSTEKTFSSDGTETVSKVTEYFYDNQDHLQLSRQIDIESNGHQTITQYKYPADYSSAEASATVNNMKGDKHMHDAAIETSVIDVAPNGPSKLSFREIDIYETLNGSILPTTKVVLDKTNLDVNTVPDYVPSAGYDNQFYRKEHDITYHDTGNTKEILRAFDFKEAFLWGYDQKYPIAKVKNAKEDQSFHSSFEDNGIEYAESHTGTKVWSGTLTIDLPLDHGDYKLSYWQKNAATGWTLIEQLITIDASAPTSVSVGSPDSFIDEVRLHPVKASMTTYTYDRLWGMTSSTDENNITTYYQYDSFGRLEFVRDSDQNIVKHYKYYYRAEQ